MPVYSEPKVSFEMLELNTKEMKLLKKLHKGSSISINESNRIVIEALRRYNLISRNALLDNNGNLVQNEIGEVLLSDNFSITDLGKRYLLKNKKESAKDYFSRILSTISLIVSIATAIIMIATTK